jgi:TonB family protein
VRLDPNGEVIDDTVLSGPDELRKGVQQSVLNWHFDKSAGSATRVVNIDFVKPATAAAIPATVAPLATPAPVVGGRSGGPAQQNPQAAEQLYLFMQAQMVRLEQRVAQNNNPTDVALLQQLRTRMEQFKEKNAGKLPTETPSATIGRIEVRGLSDSATAQLEAQLPVHAGNAYSAEALRDVAQIAHQFDEHLTGSTTGNGSGTYTIRIASPESSGAAKIGANVVAAKLITSVRPIYPPLAKMARQQGTVKFQATIGKEGNVEDLMVISGPPLLIQSAMDAVKQWVYRPTILNGEPVEVVTTIDVNFSLSDGPSAAPAQ